MKAHPVGSAELGLGGRTTLWLAGRWPPRPRLAIVGARAAFRGPRDAVPSLVAAAHRAGYVVCSGGARGIDADAHRAALAERRPQLAILPCGPDQCYPVDHAPLVEAIFASNGAVLYVRPPGSEFCRAQFASRNRWVVAAADAVVVVQADLRSGSKLTGALALAQGRPVAVVPGSPGTAWLAAAGARGLPWPGDAAGFIDAVIHWLTQRDVASTRAWPDHLEPLLGPLATAGARGRTLDQLPQAQLRLLSEAEAEGWVVEVHAGRFVLVRGAGGA